MRTPCTSADIQLQKGYRNLQLHYISLDNEDFSVRFIKWTRLKIQKYSIIKRIILLNIEKTRKRRRHKVAYWSNEVPRRTYVEWNSSFQFVDNRRQLAPINSLYISTSPHRGETPCSMKVRLQTGSDIKNDLESGLPGIRGM